MTIAAASSAGYLLDAGNLAGAHRIPRDPPARPGQPPPWIAVRMDERAAESDMDDSSPWAEPYPPSPVRGRTAAGPILRPMLKKIIFLPQADGPRRHHSNKVSIKRPSSSLLILIYVCIYI